MRFACFVVLLLIAQQCHAFDWTWDTTSISNGNEQDWYDQDPIRWYNIHIDKLIQSSENWPNQFPAIGDDVFIAEPGVYTVTLQSDADCSDLTLGSNEEALGGSGANDVDQILRLMDGAVLSIGLSGQPLDCDETLLRGSGLVNGTNRGPNYVFIESRDVDGLSPGEGSPNGEDADDFWIIDMVSPSGEIYTNAQDFNYTLQDGDDGVFLLTYYASVTGFNDLAIYCDNRQNGVPGSPFPVGFLELKPPTTDVEEGGGGAIFCDKGVCATLIFSLATNQAGLQGHFACDLLLDPETTGRGASQFDQWLGGEDAYCYWASPAVFVIVFGNNAQPTFEDEVLSTVGIRGGILEGVAPFITEPAPAVQLQIAPSADPAVPFVMIDTARELSRCASVLRMDTRASTGTGGRDWRSAVQWSLLNGNEVPNAGAVQSALQAAAAAAAGSQAKVVELDATLLEPGSRYRFGATATNWMGMSGSGEADVVRTTDDTPQIEILGGNDIELRQDSVLFLDTRVSNPCKLPVASFHFQWRGMNNASVELLRDVIEPLDFFDEETRVKSLLLPARTLRTGTTYEFSVDYTVTLSGADSNRTVTVSDRVRVTPSLGPIWAIISSGDRRIDKRDRLELDPVASVDTSATDEPFSYTWTCVRNTAPFIGRKCFDKPDLYLSSVRVDVPGNDVLTAGEYIFTLLLEKPDGRNSTTSALVTIVDTEDENPNGGVPFVLIDDLGAREHPVSEPLRLTGSIAVSSTAAELRLRNVTWEVEPDDFNFTDPANFVLPPRSDPDATPIIELRPYVLLPGIDYKFRLIGTNELGSGSATLTVRGDEPPLAGRCSATPLSGDELPPSALPPSSSTNGTGELLNWQRIVCEQWEDDRRHAGRFLDLTYESRATGREVPITLDYSLAVSHDVLLPPGTERVYARVRDAISGANRRTIAIQSPPLTLDFDVDQDFDPHIEGPMAELAALGAHDQVANYAFYFLEQLDAVYVEQDPLVEGRTSLVVCCRSRNYSAPEALSRRRARHNIVDAVSLSLLATLSERSFRTFAELSAYMTTPSNDVDENLMLELQRFPFNFMEWMSETLLTDAAATALLQCAWNQVECTPFVQFSPGRHVRIAQAIADLVNFWTMGLQYGGDVELPPRDFSWGGSGATGVASRSLSVPVGTFVSDADLHSMRVLNVSIDLGSAPRSVRSLLASRDDPIISWSLTVFESNPFYYEQSSEGINSPIVFVQIIDTEENVRMEVSGLDFTDPVRITLPEFDTVYNPLNRTEIADERYCVWWLEPDVQTNAAGYFWTNETSTAECRYTDQLELPNTNETLTLARKICQCDHLLGSEFAGKIRLDEFTDDVSTDGLFWGWIIFIVTLGVIFIGIIIFSVYYLHKYRLRIAAEKEKEFIQPPAPSTLGLERGGIDAFSDF